MEEWNIEVSEQTPSGWDEFVKSHPGGKIYHRAAWNEIVQDTFGHKIKYFTVAQNGHLKGILPLTDFKSLLFGHIAVSLPFVNYGGPLLSEPAAAGPLFDFLETYRQTGGYKSIEIRCESPLDIPAPCRQHKVTFFLDLPEDAEELMKSFKAKVRSQIRRPGKDGMYAKTGGQNLLDHFYHVYTLNMRDLGTPPLPRRFFAAILRQFSEDAFIVVVYTAEHQPAAASFLIRYGNTMEIPWASALREYSRSSPNMLLYWESFRLSISRGCRCFDFGRCTPGSGTHRFKKQWGAREQPLFWYYVLPEAQPLPQMNPENAKFDLFIKLWQKMPLAFTNSLGPMVIKHIP